MPADALKELAPTGKLRAAINYGNSVLAQKGPDGEPRGVSADLSRELAKRLGVPLEAVTFTAAGKAFEAAKRTRSTCCSSRSSRCAPPRSNSRALRFDRRRVSRPEGLAGARTGRSRSARQADRSRRNSAYDLYLTRTLKHAKLSRAEGGCCKNIDLFRVEKLDAAASIRQPLAGTRSNTRTCA